MSTEQPYYNASSPPVVQGVLVSNNKSNINANAPTLSPQHINDHHGVGATESASVHHQHVYGSSSETGGHWTKGEHQPRRCNDLWAAILFFAHLATMGFLAGTYVPRMFREVAEANDLNGRMLDLEGEFDGAGGLEGNNSWSGRFLSWMIRGTYRLVMRGGSSPFDSENRGLEDAGGGMEDYNNYDVTGTNDFADMVLLLGISSLVALVISTLALGFMIRHAQLLIKFALFFNIGATALFAIGALFLSPFAAIMGIFLTGLTIYYAYIVWGRIPFAACNLASATTAVKANLGLAPLAYSSLIFMFGWSIWWMITFVSTMYIAGNCDGQGNCQNEPSGWLVFPLMLSYHWTFQVIKNVVHVTVAGTVGTWWFVPTEAASFCSHAVRDSWLRSVTHSFGSICLGSLLVAIVEAAKNMVRNLRESDDGGGIFLCIAECLLSLLQDVLEYFNQWAFVFVGVYGYPFVQAGKNVMELFKTRGWTTIITDNLASGVLSMVSAGVGLITGLISLAIAHSQGMVFGDEVGASAASFFIGFIIGTVLTSTLMTIVSSAVNTVIVCYAEAPQEFQTNHPKLSEDMRAAWRQAWPVDFNY
mmetsp:Transcript_20316/g.40212  ORF Transcript_20316/g.40212 Transcript_20316/m.40212 type:complete len:589 (-) Transcript_20316:182-1948(-)